MVNESYKLYKSAGRLRVVTSCCTVFAGDFRSGRRDAVHFRMIPVGRVETERFQVR
jgi:hypothetical protein